MTSRIRLIHCLTGSIGLTLFTILHLAGSGRERELYRYFLPALLGAALGWVIANLRLSLSQKEEEIHDIQDLLDRELETSEGLLRTLTDMRSSQELMLDSIGEGIYRVAHDGKTIFSNRAVLSSTGFSEKELLLENHHLLLHHSQKDGSPYSRESCPVHKTCMDGKIRQVTGEVFWRKDGTSFPVEYIVTPTSEINGTYGAVVIFRDISSHVFIQQKLEESEEQFRTLLDTSTDAILILDDQGQITKANPATFRIFHCQDEKHLLGRSLMDFSPARQPDNLPSAEGLAKLLADTLSQGSSFSEWKLQRKDLQEIDVTILLARMDLGHTTFIQANIRDISLQKRDEEKLQQMKDELEARVGERTASLRQINKELQQEIMEHKIAIKSGQETSLAKTCSLINISSEIQAPIQSIINICKQIPTEELVPPLEQNITLIRRDAERLRCLSTDTLNFSQLEANNLILVSKTFNVRTSVQKTVHEFVLRATDKDISLTCDIQPAIPLLLVGDSARLQIILRKLLDNSLEFSSLGHIAVTVRLKKRLNESRIILSFSIQDSGPGREDQEQGDGLSALGRESPQGDKNTRDTGLGLSLSRKLISCMGGRTGVQNLSQEGRLFWFDLPFTVAEQQLLTEKKGEEDTRLPRQLEGYTLLLADDEYINRRMFSSILENQGAVVHCAEDGNEALEILETKNFDCILMDVQMPNCNGFEAMQAIRLLEIQQQQPRTPAIALTAHTLSGYRTQCYDAGMDDFITKPVDADLLITSICELLHARQLTDSAVSTSQT
ncbi:MAG: response regulator [Proteobacteria bacterium]|nr:response regulator [Pseudomonadota bacterium]